jgi:hypothetical protein
MTVDAGDFAHDIHHQPLSHSFQAPIADEEIELWIRNATVMAFFEDAFLLSIVRRKEWVHEPWSVVFWKDSHG